MLLLFFVYSADADPSAARKLRVKSMVKTRQVEPGAARGPAAAPPGAAGPRVQTGSLEAFFFSRGPNKRLPSPKV